MSAETPGDRSIGPLSKAQRAALAAILIVYGALYLRTAAYSFVWDDVDAIIENPLYEGPWLAGLRASQHDHLDVALRRLAEARPAHDSWRPALYLSHRLERELYGRSSVGHHLHSVALGALAILLVLALTRRWLQDDVKALVATGVFALHPLQVEAIAYVSGRGDLLSACFALASLLCALHGRSAGRRAPWVGLSTLALVLAMLAKEASLGVPIALGLIAWSQGRLRAHAVDLCAHAAGLGAYLALRLSLARAAGGQSTLEGALLLPGLWLEYLRTVLMPFDLSIVRPFDGALAVAGWMALAGLLALFVLASRKPLAEPWVAVRLASSGALFALVLIGPSAIVANIMKVAADRYAYLPLAGYTVALVGAGSWVVDSRPNLRRLVLGAGVTVALVWLAVTALQVPVWRDARALYQQAHAVVPNSSVAAYGLGLVHAKANAWAEAEPLFLRAVELDPNNARAWNNLAVCAMQRGDYTQALAAGQRALEVSTLKFRALYNVASAQLKLGRRDEGCASLRRALELNPSYSRARELLVTACSPAP
jgi:tetratricopeptide (TPR) repeat protein